VLLSNVKENSCARRRQNLDENYVQNAGGLKVDLENDDFAGYWCGRSDQHRSLNSVFVEFCVS
jgi:hypothetical protein